MVGSKGAFIISLDFELFWGSRDVTTIEKYGANILGARTAIPLMIDLFEKYGARATFAIVGLLFCKTKEEIKMYSPELKPGYTKRSLSPYEDNYFDILNENDDPYHSAAELISRLKNSPNIEVGSHTFCHYYCWEKGQTIDEFEADIKAAKDIARDNGIELKSIVFPRNQVNEDYLKVCAEHGFTHYRGNPQMFYNEDAGLSNRIMRLMDSYLNISDTTYYVEETKGLFMHNIRASRFLRPYSPSLAWLEWLKLKRIKNEMTSAAKQHKIYHLWWHPHNFGINQKQNLDMLENILKHFSFLSSKYGLEVHTMGEVIN